MGTSYCAYSITVAQALGVDDVNDLPGLDVHDFEAAGMFHAKAKRAKRDTEKWSPPRATNK